MSGQSWKSSLPRVVLRAPRAFVHRMQDVHRALQRQNRWFYDGEKLSQEAVMATALLEFLSLDPKGQSRILDRHLPAMEAMFQEMREEAAREAEVKAAKKASPSRRPVR